MSPREDPPDSLQQLSAATREIQAIVDRNLKAIGFTESKPTIEWIRKARRDVEWNVLPIAPSPVFRKLVRFAEQVRTVLECAFGDETSSQFVDSVSPISHAHATINTLEKHLALAATFDKAVEEGAYRQGIEQYSRDQDILEKRGLKAKEDLLALLDVAETALKRLT